MSHFQQETARPATGTLAAFLGDFWRGGCFFVDGHALRQAPSEPSASRRDFARAASRAQRHELRQARHMANGLRHLRFRCTACGNCCRDLRVPLTHADVKRLIDGTGRAAAEFVAWLPTAEVDLIGEPGSLVLLDHDAGHALMVLAQHAGACVFLGSDERCTAYSSRPGT